MQEKKLHEVLGQLVTTYTVSPEELSATHAYLFGQQPVAPFFTDKEVYETVLCLRETIVSKGLQDLDALIFYFTAKKAKMRRYLTEVDNEPTPLAIDTAKAASGSLRIQIISGSLDAPQVVNTIDTLAEQLFVDTRRILEELYAKASRCFESSLLPTDGGQDLYKAVRKHVQGLIQTNRPLTVHYRLSSDKSLAFSMKGYLEQFSSRYKGEQVFIMQFKKQVEKNFHLFIFGHPAMPVCSYSGSRHTYFERNQPPDYASIIDVIRREEPIKESGFKLLLTEWLVYSKLMLPSCCSNNQWKTGVVPRGSTCLLRMEDTSVRYYGGGEMQYWIHGLFEKRLSDKKWVILKRPPGHFWLTSDNPGFMINLAELQGGMPNFSPKHSLLEVGPDSILYYPLSKDYCLRLDPDVLSRDGQAEEAPIEYEMSSAGELDFVNGITVATHKEMVIANQKKTLQQIQSIHMAKNGKTGDGHRDGQVSRRSQAHNPKTDKWVKRDTDTGRFMDQKADDKPFKGVRKEK